MGHHHTSPLSSKSRETILSRRGVSAPHWPFCLVRAACLIAAEALNSCRSQRPGIASCAQRLAASRVYSQDMRCTTHCAGVAHHCQSNNSTRPISSAQRIGVHRDVSAGIGTGSGQGEEEEGRSTFGDPVVSSTPSPRTTSSSVSLASTASSSQRGHTSRCFRYVPPLICHPHPPFPSSSLRTRSRTGSRLTCTRPTHAGHTPTATQRLAASAVVTR